ESYARARAVSARRSVTEDGEELLTNLGARDLGSSRPASRTASEARYADAGEALARAKEATRRWLAAGAAANTVASRCPCYAPACRGSQSRNPARFTTTLPLARPLPRHGAPSQAGATDRQIPRADQGTAQLLRAGQRGGAARSPPRGCLPAG